MPDDAAPKPARRFLHVCYCCTDTDPVVAFFVDGLALRNTMSVPVERSGGAILGLEREVLGGAAFLYDARGPRVSPAIEAQSWIDPKLEGTPVTDPTAVGVQALGFAVPDVEAASARLTSLGCTVVGSGTSPWGSAWATVRDNTGVTLDLVADPSVADGGSRMRHLRITCTDLETSSAWYTGLGFEVVEKGAIDDAAFLGFAGAGPGRAEVLRLRLPDEPFEAVLVQWIEPASHGRHYAEPYHAGLFRTAVGVDDTRAAYNAMSAAGWEFDRAPMSVELKGTPVPDMWICFLSDPDGVPFEFVERPRSAFRS
jgi:catechol 2,3-dioxygenase-like lactoylglutathione lyase family enzyme